MCSADFLSSLITEESQESERLKQVQLERKEQDQTGRLAVIQGRLYMEEPTGRGAWPVLVPGPRVQLRQGKGYLKGPVVLEHIQDLTITLEHEPPVSDFEVIVSRDKMKVVLKTWFRPGTIYKLCDTDFQQRLVLKAEPAGTVPPKPLDPAVVLARLGELGIRPEFIQLAELKQACLGCRDAEVVVARGVDPVPPVDGRVELVCSLQPRIPREEQGDRVDFLDRGSFNAVNAGDVLAYLHPALPGKAGLNVCGEEVPPRPPREPRLAAGPGVKLIRGGRIAVAEVTGRPLYRKGVLQVNPQLVIGRNVNVITGNVDFKGDVLIMGDVEESLTVKAGGMVEVCGSVYHASVLAEGGARVVGKLIGGSVVAGTRHPGLAKALKLLHVLERDLEQLLAALHQLEGHLSSAHCAPRRSDGYLIKLLLETRLVQIPKRFARLAELLAEEELACCGEELLDLCAAVRFIARRFLGAAPLEFQGPEEVARHQGQLRAFASRLEECLESEADVEAHYCQNAKIEATGNVIIEGPLTYDCEIVAGKELHLSGQCRSGSYHAESGIYAQTVGSKGMGITTLSVGEEGVIAAQRFYPGVRLRIGSLQDVLDADVYNRLYYVREGKLLSRHYGQGLRRS